MPARANLWVAEIAGTEVRHGAMFEVPLDVFDGVELGSIGRQVLQGDASGEPLEVQARAVRLQPISYDDQLLADPRRESLQELDHLGPSMKPGKEESRSARS